MDEKKYSSEQFLTFSLAEEVYAFHVLKTKEVLEVPEITRIPKSLPYMAGVINLRGAIIPLVDLRIKFDLAQNELSENSAIIIVEVEYDDETILIGVLVDSVKKVIKLNTYELEAPPKLGMTIDNHFINSLGKFQDQLIIILNSDNLFSREELLKVSTFIEDDSSQKNNNTKAAMITEVEL